VSKGSGAAAVLTGGGTGIEAGTDTDADAGAWGGAETDTAVGTIGTLTGGEGTAGTTSSGAGTLTEGTKAAIVALNMGTSTVGFAGAAAGIEVTTAG